MPILLNLFSNFFVDLRVHPELAFVLEAWHPLNTTLYMYCILENIAFLFCSVLFARTYARTNERESLGLQRLRRETKKIKICKTKNRTEMQYFLEYNIVTE